MRWILSAFLLTACTSGAWYEPSAVEVRTDLTDIDHDQDVYDGDSLSYGVSVKWPLGLERRALEEQIALGDRLERLADHPAAPLPIVIDHGHEAATADEGMRIGPVVIPKEMMDATAVSGLPVFVWWGFALILIAASAWIFKKGGVAWVVRRLKRKPKAGGKT